MRTKRIVSSIAALTMAASVFAGLAVTASAEDITVYDSLGEWSVTNPANRVVGSVSEAMDGELAYTTVQVTAGASHSGVYNGSVHIGSTNGGAGSAATRTEGTRVATQKIRFTEGSGSNIVEYIGAAYKSGGGSHRGMDGVAEFRYNDETNILTIKAGGGAEQQVNIIDNKWYDLKVTAVYDGDTASVTMTVGDVTATGTSANKDINQFAVTTIRNGSDVSKFDSAAETIASVAPAATKLTVNYLDSESVVIKSAEEIPISGVTVGNSYNYNIPRYIVNNGALYESNLTTYTPAVTLTDAETSVDAVYTKQDTGTAYFVEHETLGGAQNSSGNYSSGVASRALDNGAEAITITEDGIYSITVAACCRNTASSSVYRLYKNSVADENLINAHDVKGISSNSIKEGGTITDQSVELKAGEKIIIQGDSGQTWVDYVLAVKTGELAPEPEKEYVDANVSNAATDNGLFIGDNGEEFPSAAVITGEVNATDLAEDDKYTWVVNVKGSDEQSHLFAKEFTAKTHISGQSDVVFGLVVYNFEKAGLTDVKAEDVQARLYLKGLDEITGSTQPIE